jgi:hypothetical protein
MDETYGLNDNTIKQLIPALGTQLKFKKALRILREYIITMFSILFFTSHFI